MSFWGGLVMWVLGSDWGVGLVLLSSNFSIGPFLLSIVLGEKASGWPSMFLFQGHVFDFSQYWGA